MTAFENLNPDSIAPHPGVIDHYLRIIELLSASSPESIGLPADRIGAKISRYAQLFDRGDEVVLLGVIVRIFFLDQPKRK